MKTMFASLIAAVTLGLSPAMAQEDAPAETSAEAPADAEGCEDHGALTRYPGSVIEWCKTDNYLPYKIPVGPVTGYRAIGDWVETEGRVTRNFYSLKGERTHPEVWKNYKDALVEAGFEIIAEGMFPESNVRGEIGGGNWLGVYYRNNAFGKPGAVNKLVSGTSSSGGTGAVFGKKERAEDTIYVLVSLEQHSKDEVAALVTVVETKEAESGLVVANAEAMGKDIEELGRTVIDGLFFDHDKATLKAESKPALDEVAKLLETMADKSFYVVGHTDATGTFAYNQKLSADRAAAVRDALMQDYAVASERLQAEGVGPLSPVFTNAAEGGREKNRRVELVEK
ncbi:OmpA family protein [Hyphococcus sp.]|uniref:OmpA family protein n=1 Tax=Hyphococcus sp. TaxID=2038636 RepID=UPI003CCC32A8